MLHSCKSQNLAIITENDHGYDTNLWEALIEKGESGSSCFSSTYSLWCVMLHYSPLLMWGRFIAQMPWIPVARINFLSLIFTNQFNVRYHHLPPSLSVSFHQPIWSLRTNMSSQNTEQAEDIACNDHGFQGLWIRSGATSPPFPETTNHLDNRMKPVSFYKFLDNAALSQNICHRKQLLS